MKSTAEKGKRFAEAVVKEYVEFLSGFAEINQTSDLYL
jgi:hypothetical protein